MNYEPILPHQDHTGTHSPEHQPPGNPFSNPDTPIPTQKTGKILISLSIALVVIGAIFIGWLNQDQIGEIISRNTITPTPPPAANLELTTFTDEGDFLNYLSLSEEYSGGIGIMQGRGMEPAIAELGVQFDMVESRAIGSAPPDRVSGTNVQVSGIDEPDIVKTDGQTIFVSSDHQYWFRAEPMLMPEPIILDDEMLDGEGQDGIARSMPYQEPPKQTYLVGAIPPEAIEKLSTIDTQGELLLHDNILIVFAGQDILAYDVSNTNQPEKAWELTLEEDQQLVTSRLTNGDLFLVSQTYIDHSRPCPLVIIQGESGLSIPCTGIHRPIQPVPIDSTYTAMKINPQTGQVSNSNSFVGAMGTSVVYMSPESLFLSYTYTANMGDIYSQFLLSIAEDLLDANTAQRITQVQEYDLSSQAKLTEMMQIVQQYQSRLPSEDRRAFETELANAASEYASQNLRRFETTGIIRLSLNNLEAQAQGMVAGRPLNQFSFDYYNDHLRVATTHSANMFMFSANSANDVYVLDQNLQKVGEVTDLGLTERIFAVRFLGDTGYVVTFRQIDPFYIIDLSNPQNPRMTGELKIPGFSSYLHPLSDGSILGVGQEDGRVKLSLFNVQDPTDPREVSVYRLDEYHSEVGNNHRAFLHDPENQIFFIPASRSAYIFSYANEEITLTKAVDRPDIRRAIFINNAFYMIGTQTITVYNQQDWTEIRSLSL